MLYSCTLAIANALVDSLSQYKVSASACYITITKDIQLVVAPKLIATDQYLSVLRQLACSANAQLLTTGMSLPITAAATGILLLA